MLLDLTLQNFAAVVPKIKQIEIPCNELSAAHISKYRKMSYSGHHKQSPICLLQPWHPACLFPTDCCDLFLKKNGAASFSRVGHDWLNWACQVLLKNKLLQMQSELLWCLQEKIHDCATIHSHNSTPTMKKGQYNTSYSDKYLKRIKCTSSFFCKSHFDRDLRNHLWCFWRICECIAHKNPSSPINYYNKTSYVRRYRSWTVLIHSTCYYS